MLNYVHFDADDYVNSNEDQDGDIVQSRVQWFF